MEKKSILYAENSKESTQKNPVRSDKWIHRSCRILNQHSIDLVVFLCTPIWGEIKKIVAHTTAWKKCLEINLTKEMHCTLKTTNHCWKN